MRKIISTIKYASSQYIGVSRKKIEAEICIDSGLTRRKAKEYVDLLIDANRIKEQDGELWYIKQEEEI